MSLDDRKNVQWKDDEEAFMPLLLLILSIILVSGRSLPYETLKDHVTIFHVDLESSNSDLGDMNVLMATWLRQGYLHKYKVDVLGSLNSIDSGHNHCGAPV